MRLILIILLQEIFVNDDYFHFMSNKTYCFVCRDRKENLRLTIHIEVFLKSSFISMLLYLVKLSGVSDWMFFFFVSGIKSCIL